MKVRLIADGSTRGTQLLDEHDNKIEGVTKVSFCQEGGMPPLLTVEILLVHVEIEGEAVVYGPSGKKVAKVVYDDGSEQEY